MKLRTLDRTGHTEVDLDVEPMIKELEKEMNRPGRVVIAQEPGKEPIYLGKPEQVRDLNPATEITVTPQLAGG